ncbi:MAG: hypothetical protein DRO08_02200 [Thermoprotei archaeon]|nr:MAG: hypothetical protein DRO08_02200 [Thermoprotei archaeon]
MVYGIMEFRGLVAVKPLELSRIIYSPGKKLFGVIINAANKPQVYSSIINLLAKYSILPTSLFLISEDNVAEIMWVLDFSNAKISVEKIGKEILDVEGVHNVKYIKPLLKSLLVDTYHFPLLVRGERACIFKKSVLRELFRDIKKRLGETGKIFLFYQGMEDGRNIFEDYRKYAKSNRGLLALFAEVVKAVGWGVVEYIETDFARKTFLLKIYECMECELCKPSKEPCGFFSKGIIAGLLSRIVNEEVEVHELMCIAKGDPYCLFRAGPRG